MEEFHGLSMQTIEKRAVVQSDGAGIQKHYEPRIAAGSIGRGKDVSAGSAFQRGFP